MDWKGLLKQRRIWAAALSLIAIVSIGAGQPQIAAACTFIAGSLGLHSYVKPK